MESPESRVSLARTSTNWPPPFRRGLHSKEKISFSARRAGEGEQEGELKGGRRRDDCRGHESSRQSRRRNDGDAIKVRLRGAQYSTAGLKRSAEREGGWRGGDKGDGGFLDASSFLVSAILSRA